MEVQTQPRLISLKQRKSGAVSLVIQTPQVPSWLKPQRWFHGLISVLMTFFQTLEAITSHKTSLIMAAGLGLGLGLTVTVAGQPLNISAVPTLPPSENLSVVKAQELRLLEHKVATRLLDDQQTVTLEEASVSVIRIDSRDSIASDLRQVKLGETIQIIGSNNGIYTYKVVELRELAHAEFGSLLQQTQPTLLVSTPVGLLETADWVIIARPLQ